jgi:hypothetical protein
MAMQSTSVDVVSVKPAAEAEPVGHANMVCVSPGSAATVSGAAEAEFESTGIRAAITVIAVMTPNRRLKWENIFLSIGC